jgi:hypothetical protein
MVWVPPELTSRFRSFHPLWDRFFMAHEQRPWGPLSRPRAFYVNPYSRRVQLEVPEPPKACRGGLLGDDMGEGALKILRIV